MFASTDASDPWNSAWTTDLGSPLAARSALAAGVWSRRFELGTVVVNTTLSTVTVTVDGVARTIPATDALILIA